MASVELYEYEHDLRRHITERPGIRCHIAFMLDQIEVFVEVGKIEKAMRWLGWVQGVLFCLGSISLNEGKEMNRRKP
jgi:hypothetical protein